MKRALAVIGIGALLMTGSPQEAPAIDTDTEILMCGEVIQGLAGTIDVGTPVSLLFFLNTLAVQSPAGTGSYTGGSQRLGSVRIVGTAIAADIDSIAQSNTMWDATGTLDPIAVGSPPVFLGGTVVIDIDGTGNDILTIGPEFDLGSLAETNTASVNVEIPNDPDPPIILPIVASIVEQGSECPVPIPATPPWGLWLLAGLLLTGLGVFMLRRRDSQATA